MLVRLRFKQTRVEISDRCGSLHNRSVEFVRTDERDKLPGLPRSWR